MYIYIYIERLRRASPHLMVVSVCAQGGDLWFWTGFSRLFRLKTMCFYDETFCFGRCLNKTASASKSAMKCPNGCFTLVKTHVLTPHLFHVFLAKTASGGKKAKTCPNQLFRAYENACFDTSSFSRFSGRNGLWRQKRQKLSKTAVSRL